MTSVYVWEGKVLKENEHLILIKTLPDRFDELSAFIAANHSYEVPEIVAITATQISEPYRAWVREVLDEGLTA